MYPQNTARGYLLITSDKTDFTDNLVAAYDYLEQMLVMKTWYLYERTAHRTSMKRGDQVYFYLAGKKRGKGNVVAGAILGGDKKMMADAMDEYGYPIFRAIELEGIRYLPTPILLRDVLDQLSFGGRYQSAGKKWGAILMGGAKALTEADLATLKRLGDG